MHVNSIKILKENFRFFFINFRFAAVCWTIHYAKRILETLFVHRFSHATMPLRNLFKNSSYYWLFAMYVGYHVNHPLYTSPSSTQVFIGAVIFLICEIGNLSIHLALKNLRPPGTTVRKIPRPTGNPFTALFNLVSCPNYTYEIGSWIGFTIMTKCLPGNIHNIFIVFYRDILLFCFSLNKMLIILYICSWHIRFCWGLSDDCVGSRKAQSIQKRIP